MPHCLGLLLPSPLRPNQVLHVVSLIFFLKINFYWYLIAQKVDKRKLIHMFYYSWANVSCRNGWALDTMSSVKLGGFRFLLEASCMTIHTEELWYSEILCQRMTIYIYIYIYVCVCVCVWMGSSVSFKHLLLNDKNTFCLYDFIKILSSFLISDLVSGWNWRMNLAKLSPALSGLL